MSLRIDQITEKTTQVKSTEDAARCAIPDDVHSEDHPLSPLSPILDQHKIVKYKINGESL